MNDIEKVTQSHHQPLGVADQSAQKGEIVRVILGPSPHHASLFVASEDTPIGAVVMLKRSYSRRIKDWAIRRLK